MNNNIYLITYSGDRTNIRADFKLYDKQSIIEEMKTNSRGRVRYGKIGGFVKLLKEMTLEEFESEFKDAGFDSETITDHFRKEISLKYGKHKEEKETKTLTLKQLKRWSIYEDFNGYKYLFLGKVKVTDTSQSEYFSQKTVSEEEGNGFKRVWDSWDSNITDCQVLKTGKKLVKEVGEYQGERKEIFEHTFNDYWKGKHLRTIELL